MCQCLVIETLANQVNMKGHARLVNIWDAVEEKKITLTVVAC